MGFTGCLVASPAADTLAGLDIDPPARPVPDPPEWEDTRSGWSIASWSELEAFDLIEEVDADDVAAAYVGIDVAVVGFVIDSDAAIVTALDRGRKRWQVALGRNAIDEAAEGFGGSIDDFPTPRAALDAIRGWASEHDYACHVSELQALLAAADVDDGESAYLDLLQALPTH